MDIEKHEQFLRNLVKQGLTNEEMQKQISARFGEDNWLFELREFLTKSVNSRISYKMKERYNNERMICELRNKIEDDVILSTNWFSYFENDVSLEELNKPLENFPLKTLMIIIIEGLKQYVDNGSELNSKCLLLRNIYLNLKETLSSQIPFEDGDGFADYLKTKQHRIDLEDARISGELCPFCESTNVKSYDFNKWQCHNCGKFFRKHRARKDED
jgi:hypothetical protein